MSKTQIHVHIDPADKILLKRHLNHNGQAQRLFTHEVRRYSDPYVPFRSGMLKNTASELVDHIDYGQPYARRQYYEHKGDGLRGPQWDKRMWADKGKTIVREIADYCGGRSV